MKHSIISRLPVVDQFTNCSGYLSFLLRSNKKLFSSCFNFQLSHKLLFDELFKSRPPFALCYSQQHVTDPKENASSTTQLKRENTIELFETPETTQSSSTSNEGEQK